MPSPFPGMDPYLEDPVYWPDLHHSFATYVRDELQSLVRPSYYARVEERVYIGQTPEFIIPDASVIRTRLAARPTSANPGAGALAVLDKRESALESDLPDIVLASLQQVREPFVKLLDRRRDGKVVTVIEILSPSNKMAGSEGRRQYQEKQAQILESDSHLVEIDLLRSGTHTAAVPLDALPYPRDWDYLVSVSPAGWRRQFEVYRRTIRERLPRISVPLSDPDPDVVLDLQSVLNRCYDNGAYGATIDYALDPLTSIKESDREWARDLPAASKIEENTELNRAGLPKEKA